MLFGVLLLCELGLNRSEGRAGDSGCRVMVGSVRPMQNALFALLLQGSLVEVNPNQEPILASGNPPGGLSDLPSLAVIDITWMIGRSES